MNRLKAHKGWVIAVAAVLLLGLAGVAGVGGCSGEYESTPTTAAAMEEAGPAYDSEAAEGMARDEAAYAPPASGDYSIDQAVGGTLVALAAGTDQKIIANAQLEIEVEAGKFQDAFHQALLLADRYGGYVYSSNSYASGEEDSIKSGTIAIRIPSSAFDNALSDAAKLGELKNQSLQTEDVTEEYVDLQARIINSEAHVNAILEVLAQAKTIDEILQVRQVLTSAQAELEQLKGRLRYLDEHTSYSTLTLSIFEAGVEVVTPTKEWGFVQALKDALHNIVGAFNSIVRGLGWLIPVLIILGIIAYVVYRIWRAARRRRERAQAQAQAQAQSLYQSYPPQGWTGPAGPAVSGGPAGGMPAQTAPDADQKNKGGKTS